MVKVVRKSGPGGKRLAALLEGLETVHAKVGFPKNAMHEESNTSLAYIAVIHENGVPELNIPKRDFMSQTVKRCEKDWIALVRNGVAGIAVGSETTESVMETLAGNAENDVKETLEALSSPELHAGTVIAREKKQMRGADIESLTKPLIETGYLIDHVTHVVEKGKAPKGDSE